jgi:hypothetical protein
MFIVFIIRTEWDHTMPTWLVLAIWEPQWIGWLWREGIPRDRPLQRQGQYG